MIQLNDNVDRLRPSDIRRFTALAKEREDCVLLTIGEPDFDTPQPIKDAAWAALRDNQTHYAPNQGLPSLREAIAAYETERGMACTPDQVLVTAGASGALFTALMGILNPGDQVVIPTPAFPIYESILTMAGAVPVPLHTKNDNFQITKDSLERVITGKTKAILLNSPNNPTGAVYSRASLEAVKAAVLGRDILVICDNVYQQLSYGDCPDLTLDGELRNRMILCQSFSKPYAMTGWRVGYLVAEAALVKKLVLVSALQLASIPTFLQTACITALRTDVTPMREVYRRRRDYVCGRLREMGLTFPEPKGAFYVFPDISRFGLDDQEFCVRMIREAAVAAVPGDCFGTRGHIRLSYCCADESLKLGMDRMESFLHSLSENC